MKIRKAFKFRIYPNQVQKDALEIQFGHTRFVYNRYRTIREAYYKETLTGLTYRGLRRRYGRTETVARV